ncbi:MAG TPA: hypothetical protein VJ835_12485 [Fimbriimonadaceae bacterium]|nr:hypothetical protein [Fimbriimonadaceae bacterium]
MNRISARKSLRVLSVLIVLILTHLSLAYIGSRIVGSSVDAKVKTNGRVDVDSQVFKTSFYEVIVKSRYYYLIRPTLNGARVFLLSNQYVKLSSLLLISGFEDELQITEEGSGELKNWKSDLEWTSSGFKFRTIDGDKVEVTDYRP